MSASGVRRLPCWILTSTVAAVVATVGVFQVAAGQVPGRTNSNVQNVAPAFEGWEENVDGSFNLVFGYLNRNWDEEIDVPIGPDNNVEPGGPDQGQPTRLLPRRNLFIFRVHVPKDFGTKEIVWTLTTHGKTERAYGTLKSAYFIDDNVISANNGASGGAGTTLELQNLNKAPVLKVEGSTTLTAKVGQPVTLTAIARDDNLPRPRGLAPVNPLAAAGAAVSSAVGLRLAWFVYRGAGQVTFDPPQFKVYMDSRGGSPWAPGWNTPPVPPGGKWVIRATFTEPGTYVLRCLAHDGALATAQDVTVTVTG